LWFLAGVTDVLTRTRNGFLHFAGNV
jgi:hypothetical protein